MIVKVFFDEILQVEIGVGTEERWHIWCDKCNAWIKFDQSGRPQWVS